MNLVYNFKNKLFWIQNFLPKNTYEKMYVNFIKNRNKINFKKTTVSWKTFKEEEENMSESFSQDPKKSLYLNDYLKTYHTLLKHQSFVNLMNYEFESHLRKFSFGQHLTWHNDDVDNRGYAATFYFNKTWRDSWGGELMFKCDEGAGFIPVVGNSVAIVKAGLTHKVNSNLKKTHTRINIQTWIRHKT